MSTFKLHLSVGWNIIWCLLGYTLMATSIDCSIQQCQNTIIDCLPNQDCYVSCHEPQSCIASIINCPLNGNCDISCNNKQSCQDTIINATLSNGNFNLLCAHSTDHCKGINVYGSILPSNTGTFSVVCDGKMRACIHSQIHCPITGDCIIQCNGDTSCRLSQINGPSIDGDLNIHCNGVKSCFDAIFNAKTSSALDITGCTAFESCSDLTLYCPPNTNGIKHCFIEGNNNLNRNNNGGTTIYAIYGFNDIQINYYGTFDTNHGGKMLCGSNYDISCNIQSDDWSCADSNDICNNSFITSIPTLSTSITMLYTSIYHEDDHDDDDEESYDNHIYDHELGRDRGVTWLLEVRVIFGGGVLLTIVVVAICCYISNRHNQHYTKAVSHDISRHCSRTYTHHSSYDYSKTMEIDDTFQLNRLCNDVLTPRISCNIDITDVVTPRPEDDPRQSLTPHNSVKSDDSMYLNPIQAEIVAMRQLLTLRKLVTQRKDDHDTDGSDIGSADTDDLIQRNRFGEESETRSLSPKTPVLAHNMSSTMTIFNLNDEDDDKKTRCLHQRTQGVDIKPDIVSKIVSKFNKHEIERKKRKSLSNKKISILQCPKQKSYSRKKKSPSSLSAKDHRKGTLLSLTQKSDYHSTNANDSETDIESHSESNDKTKTENVPLSTTDDNAYSSSSTYDPSDPIPTAC